MVHAADGSTEHWYHRYQVIAARHAQNKQQQAEAAAAQAALPQPPQEPRDTSLHADRMLTTNQRQLVVRSDQQLQSLHDMVNRQPAAQAA